MLEIRHRGGLAHRQPRHDPAPTQLSYAIDDHTGHSHRRLSELASLMKALTPIGPLVGKMMGQPPNLRELISSADSVTFWATNEKAVRERGFAPRGIEEGLRQTLEADDRFPSPAPA